MMEFFAFVIRLANRVQAGLKVSASPATQETL